MFLLKFKQLKNKIWKRSSRLYLAYTKKPFDLRRAPGDKNRKRKTLKSVNKKRWQDKIIVEPKQTIKRNKRNDKKLKSSNLIIICYNATKIEKSRRIVYL